MFTHQEHDWFIGCVFNTPCPTCAFYILWSCIAHSQLLHTPLLSLSCIGLYLVSSSQHIMFTLYFVTFLFCLLFELLFSFISHPSCIIILVPTFISYLYFSLNLCLFVTKRGRIYSREYTGEFCHFYMTLVHILRGKIFISHAHLQGEMHIPRGRRHYINKKTLFCLCFLFALWCFELCLVSMLCCSYCIVFVCWTCILLYAIVLH